MPVELGIVGLPNVGKSTLFNALTQGHAVVANYPFTTIEPNVGVVAVPDQRLDDIARIIEPQQVTPSTLRLLDIAGLVGDAHKGEGLGNQFLGHIRNVDAIAMVVRAFHNPDVPHVTAELSPVADVQTVALELVLADLATVERRAETTRSAAKAHPTQHAAEMAALDVLKRHLLAGEPARTLDAPAAEALASELNLLTGKPILYVANVAEDDLPGGGELTEPLRTLALSEQTELLLVCAACEAALGEWDREDARSYLRELGLEKPGLDRFITAGYRLLNLITFFTTTGNKEVRAWPLRSGATVLEAAGRIHTDMRRGFIKAEVISYDDLSQAGSSVAARDRGLVHIVGRDYVVQDGDIVHVRFNL